MHTTGCAFANGMTRCTFAIDVTRCTFEIGVIRWTFAIGFHCFCFLSTMKWKYPLAFQNFPWRSGLCHRVGNCLWKFPRLLFPLHHEVEISTRVLELSLKKWIMPPVGLLIVEISTTTVSSPISSGNIHSRSRTFLEEVDYATGRVITCGIFHYLCFLSTIKWKYPLAFQNFPWPSGLCHRLGYCLWNFPLPLFPVHYQVEISTRVPELSF